MHVAVRIIWVLKGGNQQSSSFDWLPSLPTWCDPAVADQACLHVPGFRQDKRQQDWHLAHAPEHHAEVAADALCYLLPSQERSWTVA